MQDLVNLFLLVTLGSVAGLIGGVIFLVKEDWARKLTRFAVPLASGVLLAVSFLDLLPEAAEEIGIGTLSQIVLGVFVALFLIEKFLFHLHHHNDHSHSQEAVPLVIFGDTLHNFLDGVAIAASYLIEPSLGLVVALATFLHETPHEIADFGILLSAGWSRIRTFRANLFSALATFPGAFLTYYFSSKIEESVGMLLALAVGLFLYVAATDFLPETKNSDKKSLLPNTLFFLLGIAIIVLMGSFVPEVGH